MNMTNKKIRVFLSRPNPFTNEQQYFIDKLKSTLENYNIESITLQTKDYSPYESLSALNENLETEHKLIYLYLKNKKIPYLPKYISPTDNNLLSLYKAPK